MFPDSVVVGVVVLVVLVAAVGGWFWFWESRPCLTFLVLGHKPSLLRAHSPPARRCHIGGSAITICLELPALTSPLTGGTPGGTYPIVTPSVPFSGVFRGS